MNILLDGQFQKDAKQDFSLVPSQTNSQLLVRDAGAEKLLRRLEKIEVEEKERAIQKEKDQFAYSFRHLAHEFFGVGENEIRKLEEDELNALRRIVAYRVKRRWRTLFAVNGFFCAVLGILALCVHGAFLILSPLLIFNVPILEEFFQHHFTFSHANKWIEKFTPDMIS